MAVSFTFQKRLNELIDDYECPRSELSAQSKVNSGTISHALAYGIIPSIKSLIKLADYFNVSLLYLLCETDENDFIKSDTPSTFQERFEALCKENQITHYKISQKCYFDPSIISRWLSRGYLPELDILKMLCKEFKVSPDYLLGRTDYRK